MERTKGERMRKTVRAIALLASVMALASCSEQEQAERRVELLDAPSTPAPTPPDTTFADPTTRAAWEVELARSVAAVRESRDASAFLAMADSVEIDPAVLVRSSIPSPLDRQIPEPLVEIPTREEAAKSERAGEHFYAGKVYLAQKDTDGAKRCAAKLEQKLEWAAVAELAVGLGDTAQFDRAIDAMLEADMVTIVGTVQIRALEEGRVDLAERVARRTGRLALLPHRLPFEGTRRLAEHGQPAYYTLLLTHSITVGMCVLRSTEPGGCGELGQGLSLVTAIPELARYDRPAALAAAREALALPQTNVVIDAVQGEGMQASVADPGLLFYRLIRSDAELRAAYLAHVHAYVDDLLRPVHDLDGVENTIVGDHSGPSDGYALVHEWLVHSGNYHAPLRVLLGVVASINDATLTAAWNAELARIAEHYPFAAQIGRMALGKRPDPDAKGLSDRERITLKRLLGPVSVPEQERYVGSPTCDGIMDAVALAGRPKKDFRRLLQAMGIDAPKPSRRYERGEIRDAARIATRLFQDSSTVEQGVSMWIDILASDPRIDPPVELEQYEAVWPLLQGRGRTPYFVEQLAHGIAERYTTARETHRVAQQAVVAQLSAVRSAAVRNTGSNTLPNTPETGRAILREALARHRANLGPSFESILVQVAVPNHEELIADEIERLRTEHRLADIERLTEAASAIRSPYTSG